MWLSLCIPILSIYTMYAVLFFHLCALKIHLHVANFGYYFLDVPDHPRMIEHDNYTVTFRNVSPNDTMTLQCNASNRYNYLYKNFYLNPVGEYDIYI